MEELRPGEAPHVAESRYKGLRIVPVHRAHVVESELLEERPREDHALEVLMALYGDALQEREVPEEIAAPAHDAVEVGVREYVGEVLRERPDGLRNRHLVVVEDHEEVLPEAPGVVQCLKGHAARHGAIADDRAGFSPKPLARGGDRHAERDAD